MRRWGPERALGWSMSLAGALGWGGCSRLPEGPAATTRTQARGITFVDWSPTGYASPAASRSLADLATTGANTVVIVVTAYQSDRFASELRPLDARTPTPGAVRRVIEAAAALGLDVVLKPHVDVDDGTWRGRIEPRDPVHWFESYRSIVLSWAALADSVGSRDFVAGTELAGTVEHAGLWKETIQALRRVFRGRLTYAAARKLYGEVRFNEALKHTDALTRVIIDGLQNWKTGPQSVELMRFLVPRDLDLGDQAQSTLLLNHAIARRKAMKGDRYQFTSNDIDSLRHELTVYQQNADARRTVGDIIDEWAQRR